VRTGSAASLGLIESPLSWATDAAYPAGFRMGLLAPGLLKVGDVSQLVALSTPRPVVVRAATSAGGKRLTVEQMKERLAFAASVFRLVGAEKSLDLADESDVGKIANLL